MKKGISILVAFLMIVSFVNIVTAASANNVPTFKVDGKLFITPEGEPQPYINKDNRTMGSLRLIATALGVESKNIKWNNTAQVATLTRGDNTVSVTVGKKVITVNGKAVTMDTVAEMKQGRVFIPARYIGEGLGVTVKFESATNSVLFITKQESEISYDNFTDMGFKRLVNLPFTQETSDGLKLTVHSAYLYKTSSVEAKALHKTYNFDDFDKAQEILFLNFTLENNTGRVVQYNGLDMSEKIVVTSNWGVTMERTISDTYLGNNSTNYLWEFRLEAGEKITSNLAFLNLEKEPIDFVGIGNKFKLEKAYQRIAEKVN